MNQGPLRTPYDKNPGAQSGDVRCGGMGGWADGEVMLRKSGRGLANSTRADTHTHTHIRTHTAPLSQHTHSGTLRLTPRPAFTPSSSQPVFRSRLLCLSATATTACPAPKRPPPPPRGPEDPAEAASSGDGGRTHTHMSRHSTQAKSRTASCEYKSVGEAGNARQGIRSASSDGKTMISMATHDTRSESDGRSAFGSPGAEAAPASDSTGGGPITLNVFPNRAAGPCAGLFYVVMRLDGAPSTGNGQIPAGQRADRGYLETTSRGDARRPEGRRRC